MKKKINPDTLGNPSGMALAIDNYISKGLKKEDQARFKSYRVMEANNISLTSNQKLQYERLKTIVTNNLRNRWK
jgi:hypothetical protein